jgi:CheY-like chemotaxis protein
MNPRESLSQFEIGTPCTGCGDGGSPQSGRWADPAASPLDHGPPMPGQSVPMPGDIRQGPGKMGPAAGVDGVRCVIVDDNDRFIELVAGLLRGDGFDVVGVACGSAQALRLIAEVSPDVALIDLHLGQDNGIEVIADIVNARLAEGMVTILISTCAENDLRELFGLSAADAYLPKMDLSSGRIRDILHGNGNGDSAGR